MENEDHGPDPVEGEGTKNSATPTSGETFQPPSDGSWVPRERLNTVLEKLALLDKRLDKREEKEKPSREKLLQGVEEGEITQAQADAISEADIIDRVTKNVTSSVDASSKMETQRKMSQDYEAAIPELLDHNSDAYKKGASEYSHLVDVMGQPEDWGTVVVALRSAFGPLDALKTKIKPQLQQNSHEETGGAGGEKSKGTGRQAKLSDRQKDHYTAAIRAGAYTGWDAVFDELGIEKSKKK